MLERLWIQNRRGLRLAALLYDSRQKAKRSPETGPGYGSSPLVIVCHGFTGSKEGGGGATEMALNLCERGFSTLLFDFAGCGESEGRWYEISLSRHVEDLGSAVRWGREAGFHPIILNGRSFGGTTAICYAARDSGIAGVCTWAAVGRPGHLFKRFLPEDGTPGGQVGMPGEAGPMYLEREFFNDLDRHDVPACAGAVHPRPMLVIHGAADESVPPGDARLICEAAGKNAELAMIEGADHRFSGHAGQVWERFFRWLQEYFPTVA